MDDQPETCSRRDFMRRTGSCGAHLLLAGAWLPVSARRLFAARPCGLVQAVEPWGRIEEVAEGVWAMVSTPLGGDFTTISNGGIIAGRDAVLAIEGLGSVDGARWLGDASESLTGRRPTHVVLTHYHGDHSAGQAGYADGERTLRVVATAETQRLLESADGERLLPNVILNAGEKATEIDLGGRKVTITAREGHTSSDVTVEIDDPRVVWCGDLVWNRMFPNYRDAKPSRLIRHVREVLSDSDALYVPGHGALSDHAGLRPYIDMLEHVGEAAQAALDRGTPVEAAAAEYRVPESLGEWTMFSPRYYEVAFRAWASERDA